MQKSRNIIIVHSEKPQPDGAISLAYIERLEVVINLINIGDFSTIITTSGQTRPNAETEAKQGFDYLKSRGVTIDIVMEDQSKTTVDNVRCVSQLEEFQLADSVIAIFSSTKLWRCKRAYEHICPTDMELERITILGIADSIPWGSKLLEPYFRLISLFDPLEQGRFTKWMIAQSRNG